MSEQHKEQTDAMTKLKTELQGRVGVLEKWRWIDYRWFYRCWIYCTK